LIVREMMAALRLLDRRFIALLSFGDNNKVNVPAYASPSCFNEVLPLSEMPRICKPVDKSNLSSV